MAGWVGISQLDVELFSGGFLFLKGVGMLLMIFLLKNDQKLIKILNFNNFKHGPHPSHQNNFLITPAKNNRTEENKNS